MMVPRDQGTISFSHSFTRETVDPHVLAISKRIFGRDVGRDTHVDEAVMVELTTVSDDSAVLIIRINIEGDFDALQVVHLCLDRLRKRIEWKHLITFDSRGAIGRLPTTTMSMLFQLVVIVIPEEEFTAPVLKKLRLLLGWFVRPELKHLNPHGLGFYHIGSRWLLIGKAGDDAKVTQITVEPET
jgi:hypothetical protein